MIQEFRVDKYKLLFDLQPEEFTSDRNLLWYAQNRQLPEPEVVHVMLRALKAGDCAVDAGANVGFFTVLMSKIVGPDGFILAAEPDKRNVAKLRKNLDINSCTNVRVLEVAFGADAGSAELFREIDNGKSSLHNDATESETVQVARLEICLLGWPRPSFLKMDIEGSEVAALQGCAYDFPCIVAEVNHGALQRAGSSAHDLFALLRERGYARYQPHASGAMPSRILSSQSIKLTRENANMVFAHPGYVEEKLWPEIEI